jgi:hypothetical protein
MRTTLNLPDKLVAEAKRRALSEGTTLTELLTQGLESRLERHARDLTLPVSKAGGGLVSGVHWENLEAAEDRYR